MGHVDDFVEMDRLHVSMAQYPRNRLWRTHSGKTSDVSVRHHYHNTLGLIEQHTKEKTAVTQVTMNTNLDPWIWPNWDDSSGFCKHGKDL
jgi:hypothetical protein